MYNSHNDHVSKMYLFGNFALGREVTIWDDGRKVDITGYIQGIKVESCYTPPKTPSHFLVDITVTLCNRKHLVGSCVESVYVRTMD